MEPKVTLNFEGAVLTNCFQDETHAFAGGLDCAVWAVDLQSGTNSKIGLHSV